MKNDHFAEFATKMRNAGLSQTAIQAFRHNYNSLSSGHSGMIAEASIQPLTTLPCLEELREPTDAARELLSQTVVLKLNGGLGTSMGLEKAKSLLPVKDGMNLLTGSVSSNRPSS